MKKIEIDESMNARFKEILQMQRGYQGVIRYLSGLLGELNAKQEILWNEIYVAAGFTRKGFDASYDPETGTVEFTKGSPLPKVLAAKNTDKSK